VSYLIAEYYDVGEYPSEHAAACEDLYCSCPYTKGRKPARVWADSQIFYTNIAAQRASLNKKVSDVFRREAGLNVVPSNKDRKAGWRHMKELLAWKKNEQGVFTRTPSLYYFPECVNFEREIKDAVHSETGDREDIDNDGSRQHVRDPNENVRTHSRTRTRRPLTNRPGHIDKGMLFIDVLAINLQMRNQVSLSRSIVCIYGISGGCWIDGATVGAHLDDRVCSRLAASCFLGQRCNFEVVSTA
jgi:hypothetical protein